MSTESDFLAEAIAEAQKPGSECVPQKLLSVAACPDPIKLLLSYDGSNDLFGALTEEFGFIQTLRLKNIASHDTAFVRLTGLLRWLIRSIREWSPGADQNDTLLVTFFVISRYCQNAGSFWPLMPKEASNAVLLEEIESRLKRIRVSISMQDKSFSPISDQESITRLIDADETGNWSILLDSLRAPCFFPDTFTVESSAYLHRYGRKKLLCVVSGIHQIFVAFGIIEALTPDEQCQLSLETDNSYIDFVVLYRCIVFNSRGDTLASIPSILSDVLQKIAQNDDRWASFMNAFNRYPIRYPALAPFLGIALTDVPDRAVRTYINSIQLDGASSISRQTVADALIVFYKNASEKRRHFLWKEAFCRWEAWNFGDSDTEIMSVRICRSDLDFAVVGFAAECMTYQEKVDYRQAAFNKMCTLDLDWHESHTLFLAKKNRLLSALQPIARALMVQKADQWLSEEGLVYMPFDKSQEPYAAFLLSI